MLEGQNRNQLSVFKCKMRTKNSCNNKEIEKRLTQYLLNSGAEALIWTLGGPAGASESYQTRTTLQLRDFFLHYIYTDRMSLFYYLNGVVESLKRLETMLSLSMMLLYLSPCPPTEAPAAEGLLEKSPVGLSWTLCGRGKE